MDISRHEIPPGGWVYRQPQINWSAPTPLNSTFDQTVLLILQQRRKNMPAAVKYSLSLDPYIIGNELEDFTRKRLKLPGRNELPKNLPLSGHADSVGAVAGVKRAVVGIGVMVDWLGDGLVPVKPVLAEQRAKTCVDCPQNSDPNWMQKLDGAVAEGVRRLIGVKNDMNLVTSFDSQLHSCQMCDCRLTLKVWTPIENVVRHLKAGERDKLKGVRTRTGKPCWIISES